MYNQDDDVFDIAEEGKEEPKERKRRISAVDIAFFVFMLLIASTAFFFSFRKDFFSGFVASTNASTPPEIVTKLIVNINTATFDELMQLDGIGEVLAGRVISYREEQGLFENVQDIVKVEGISVSLFEKLYQYLTV